MKSWMTNANTGNRLGKSPARMVGQVSSFGKRKPGMEAGRVLNRAVGEGHGRPSPTLFCSVVAVMFFSIGAFAQTNVELPAGRKLTPAQPARRVGAAFGAPQYRSYQRGRPVTPAEAPPTPEELAAARGMESMMVDMLIQEMRKTVPENDVVPLSQGERIF